MEMMTKENTYQNWKNYTSEEMADLGLTFKAINNHFKNLTKNKEAHIAEAKKAFAEQLFDMAGNYEIYYNWDWIAEVKNEINKDYWTEQLEITEEELFDYIKHAYNVLVYALGEEFNKREVLQNYLTENTEAHIEALRDFDETLLEEGYEDLNELLYGKTPEEIFWLGHFSKNLAGKYYYLNGYNKLECDDEPVKFIDENSIDEEAEFVLENLDNYYFKDDFKEYFSNKVGLYKDDKYYWIDEVFEDLLF